MNKFVTQENFGRFGFGGLKVMDHLNLLDIRMGKLYNLITLSNFETKISFLARLAMKTM